MGMFIISPKRPAGDQMNGKRTYLEVIYIYIYIYIYMYVCVRLRALVCVCVRVKPLTRQAKAGTGRIHT